MWSQEPLYSISKFRRYQGENRVHNMAATRSGVVLGWALILMFAGSTSSTVYREVVYKDNACTTENYTAEFFGIPDSVGLQDLGACIPNTDNSTNSYIEYKCINSSVVAGMYSDASCTDPVEGVASAEVTNGVCTRNMRRSCSTTDPSTSASHNFSISTKYFKSSPSCLERNMVMETKHDTQEFRHPLTKSTSECTWTDNVLFGFNSKLACVDGELKTFYYEASDMRCMSSPKAVVDSPSCMKVDGVDLYHKLSCKDPSSSEKVPVTAPPPLDRDSSDGNMTYFHVMTYYGGDNDTGSCSVLESEQYYSAYPGEEPGMSLKFGECGEYGGGYFAMTECDEDSGAIGVSLHLGGIETTDQCPPETVVTHDDDVYKSGSCMDSKKRMCTTTAPTYENTIDDWDVLLEYHEDDICSSSTGKKESVDWMEIPRSSLNDGSSVDYEISFVYEKAMESKSCSTNGRYKTELNCVDGTVKLVVFPGEDTNCSTMPVMVSQIPSCLAMDDEGEYAKMSCYGMYTSSAHHLSKPLWLFGSTITTAIMVLLFTSATGNF